MARDSCLARVTAGVAVGGAVGGAVGKENPKFSSKFNSVTCRLLIYPCYSLFPFVSRVPSSGYGLIVVPLLRLLSSYMYGMCWIKEFDISRKLDNWSSCVLASVIEPCLFFRENVLLENLAPCNLGYPIEFFHLISHVKAMFPSVFIN